MDRFKRDLDHYLQRSDVDDDLRREDIDAKRAEAQRRASEKGNDPWAGPFGDYAITEREKLLDQIADALSHLPYQVAIKTALAWMTTDELRAIIPILDRRRPR